MGWPNAARNKPSRVRAKSRPPLQRWVIPVSVEIENPSTALVRLRFDNPVEQVEAFSDAFLEVSDPNGFQTPVSWTRIDDYTWDLLVGVGLDLEAQVRVEFLEGFDTLRGARGEVIPFARFTQPVPPP